MGQLRTEGIHLKNDANLFQFYKEQNFENQKPIKKNGIAAATTSIDALILKIKADNS